LYKIPKREEYFYHDGKFYMKSKTAKGIKLGALIGFIVTFLFGTSTVGSHYMPGPKAVFYSAAENNLTNYIQSVNKNVSYADAVQIVKSTMKWANEFELDPALLIAIQEVESKFNKHGISSAGAMGLMQVIPSWHLNKMSKAIADVGNPEPFNINTNIYLGSWVLKLCMKQFNLTKNALLCYNGSNANPNGYDVKVMQAYNMVKKVMKGS
jgi:soluble lytic murein transglycosylase-like protein